MIVASIDTRTGNTALISLPRQPHLHAVPEGLAAAQVSTRTGFGKEGLSLDGRLEWMLTAMYQNIPDAHPGILGPSDNEGADVLKQSVGEATGLKLDYYLQVNLQGFPELVDAIGGITVNVNERVAMGGISSSHIPPAEWIEPGPSQHLDGRHALWFARGRYGADDDQRQIRQRCAIKGIVDAADPQTLVTKYQAIAKAGQHLLRTDIPQELLPALVELALKVKSGTVSNVTLDVVEAAAEVPAPRLRRPARHRREGARSPTRRRPLRRPPRRRRPSKSTRKPVAPPPTPAGPTQNLVDACAYHPNGDQPN